MKMLRLLNTTDELLLQIYQWIQNVISMTSKSTTTPTVVSTKDSPRPPLIFDSQENTNTINPICTKDDEYKLES